VYPGILFAGDGCSTNSVENREQRRVSGGGSPPVRGSAQFENVGNPFSY
jgi:hypothetical protein